jgi:hypothetical protein
MPKLPSIISRLRLFILSLRKAELAATIKKIQDEKLTYLSLNELLDLINAAQSIDNSDVDGIFIEAGCALGGSAICLTAIKSKSRPFFVYDTFEMIPAPTKNDGVDAHQRYGVISSHQAVGIGTMPYYGYMENLLDQVTNSFMQFGYDLVDNNIHFVKGLFENTLIVNCPVALAHIDCDWYESVMTCLQQIEPNLSIGGKIIIDDYFHWSGCKKAVDEFFSMDRRKNFTFSYSTHLVITKIQ